LRALILLTGVLVACSPRPSVATTSPQDLAQGLAAAAGAEFRGHYSAGFEEEAFLPCGVAERWWVFNAGPIRTRYVEVGARPYEPVFAVIRGDTSGLGHVGHLGLYQRFVRVHEVVHMERLDSLALQRRPLTCADTTRGH
jgi:hypothetical protein